MDGTPLRPVRVLLVDDEPAVRRGLALRLAAEPDLVVVGEAGDGRTAVALACELAPDVVLMDAAMPTLDGFRATRLLRRQAPGTRVVILSLFDERAARNAARRAGAVAFVPKLGRDADLLDTIRGLAPPEGNRS